MAGVGAWLRGLLGRDEQASEEPGPGSLTRVAVPPSFADGNNEFALALYAQLRNRPGNLFLSPFSIRTALAMAQAGARGNTAEEMRRALCISSPDETMHEALAEAIVRLRAAGNGDYEMAVANALWSQDGAPLQPEFVDLVARQYGGAIEVTDFRHDAEAARLSINRWVETKTRQKIRDLIPSGGLTALTRLVVVNAIYFKGMWALPFRKADTRNEPFYLEEGGEVHAQLMHQLEEVRYTRARGYQAVELLYQGDDISMLILLPDQNKGLRDLEETLLARRVLVRGASMAIRVVRLALPRFKISWGAVALGGQLEALGMALPFTENADFSGINGHKPPDEDSLTISNVVHKAVVEVNEEGTEAAAATAVVMVTSSMLPSVSKPTPVFRADHPFLFVIRERRAGTILFLGRVTDPTREV